MSTVDQLLADAINLINQARTQLTTTTQPTVKAGDSLKSVLAAAPAGATILLDPGYVTTESITIDKSVTILGQTNGTTRMDLTTPLPSILGGTTITGPNVIIKGVEFRHPLQSNTILTLNGVGCVLDQCRVLGDPVKGQHRGIQVGGGQVSITRSYIDQIFSDIDTQAIGAYDMSAPGLTVDDCYLSASGETFLLGGADPSDITHIPSQIVVKNSTLTKNLAWRGTTAVAKNVLELKNCKGVEVFNCDLSNSWKDGQVGYLLVMTVRNQSGGAPYSTIEDVNIHDNHFHSGCSAIQILGTDDTHPSQTMNRVTVKDNLFDDLDRLAWGDGSDKLIAIGGGPKNLTIDHNTFKALNLRSTIYFGGPACENLVVTNNTWTKTKYGIFGVNVAVGPAAWTTYTSGTSVLAGNVETI